jgi:type I restriction enzyme, S subunit
MKNIPKLRFKDFKETWDGTKLGNVATFSKGKGLSKSDLIVDGKNECIRYGELYTLYGETISDVVSRTNIDIESLVLSEANDVIIPASGETQIDIATASCVLRKGIALGGDLNVIKTSNNGVFLSYYLNSKKKRDIASLAQGISVVHLYAGQLSLLGLNLPSLSEQQKIASFLSAVDEKIQYLVRKKQLLEQYKKGVMQQLFSGKLWFKPAPGEVPGDENGKAYPKWEEKKLGDVCESIKSGKDKVDEKGSFPLFGSTGRIGSSIEYSHDGSYILIARVGANAGTINLVQGKFAVSDNTLVVNCMDARSIRYIFYFLSFFNLNKLIFGSGQPLITGGQLKDLLFPFPSAGEQQRIASFLTALDAKIEAVNTQITQTQTFKKGLLQQMFV